MRSVVVICLDCQTKWEKYQRRKVESIDHENVKISVIMKVHISFNIKAHGDMLSF
jgi:hypothetical protein